MLTQYKIITSIAIVAVALVLALYIEGVFA